MSGAALRAYPSRPFVAASIAVFREGRVLLAERVAPPGKACFSLPGGIVESGETLEQAALRELQEETGVLAAIVGFNDHVEIIERDEQGRVAAHFVVASFVGLWRAGEGLTGPEAKQVIWTRPAEIEGLTLTPGLAPLLLRAEAIAATAVAATAVAVTAAAAAATHLAAI